ncbi:MAG: hypothetical protein HOP19_29230 [Acidobacteria bacterium]|nr:hypothetical protein [Acidobacteriota bacterium]
MSEFVNGAGLGPVSIVTRSPNHLDAFAVSLDGQVYTAAWQPEDTEWRGWWPINGVEVAPCAPVCAVSRSTDKLDVFVVGLDGQVYTAAWELGDTAWRGWWPVGNLKTVLHASISAVSRSTNLIDIFVAGLDGGVYTAAWQPGDDQWRGWWRVGDIQVPPGAPISAVSRSKDKLDAFVVGADWHVYTAAWEPEDTEWRGWWLVGELKVVPRTPVAAVCRAIDKLDVFVVGKNGRLYTAAWEEGDTQWRGWWTIANFVTQKRTAVSAVSRSVDKLDVFATGTDGRVYTAAWQPDDMQWRGWWVIGEIVTMPGIPVGVVSRSADMLDVVVPSLDGRVYTAAWQPGDAQWRGWWRISNLITGFTDPQVGSWTKVGVAFYSENTAHSEEAQGITTDGEAWFLSSNNSKTIRKYDASFNLQAEKKVPQGTQGGHIGAPGCYEGWIYVPVQHPYGVWKAKTNLSARKFLTGEQGTDRFPWCDVNPLNGRLYTSEFDHWNNANGVLFAYDQGTLERRPEDDIGLGNTPIHFDRIQGGVFTRRGRVIISRSGPNGIFCFSSITGHCFGGRYLGDFGSTGSEVEGVTIRAWQFDGTLASVHVLELDNDWSNGDDCYLHSYWVPNSERL